MTRKQNKTWKAWAVFRGDGKIAGLYSQDVRGTSYPMLAAFVTRKLAKEVVGHIADEYATIAPVTISLSKPKRQARKVK